MPSRRRRTDAAMSPTRCALSACDGGNVLNRVFPIDAFVHGVRGLTASARTAKAARTGARAA